MTLSHVHAPIDGSAAAIWAAHREFDLRYSRWLTEREPPEGNVRCDTCHAVIAWEGETPEDCLRCGSLELAVMGVTHA